MSFPRKSVLPDPSASPPDSSLCCESKGLGKLFSTAYWGQLCPKLHVSDTQLVAQSKPFKLSKSQIQDFRKQIDAEGVFQVQAEQLPWVADMHDMAAATAILIQHGWPSPFLIVYDEVWALVRQVSTLMKKATGNECNMDVLAWYIDPNRGDAGFSPHRDRQPDDVAATFRPDGSAKYSTCWIPFTDACPENSCLYVVPRHADPGYSAGDAATGPDPLQVALHSKESYQHVRALPAEAGAAVVFTHRILHWGSRGRQGYHTPRVSMSFGCADDSYEPAYFSRQHLPFPPLELRVALACAQMIVYHERFEMSGRQLAAFYEGFMKHSKEFDKEYRLKVVAEFVSASKEVTEREAAAQQQRKGKKQEGSEVTLGSARPAKRIKVLDNGHHEEEPDEDDVLDMALDAMLEARMEGCDEFADDFDDGCDDISGLEDAGEDGDSDEEDDAEEEEEEEGEEGAELSDLQDDDAEEDGDAALMDAAEEAGLVGSDDSDDGGEGDEDDGDEDALMAAAEEAGLFGSDDDDDWGSEGDDADDEVDCDDGDLLAGLLGSAGAAGGDGGRGQQATKVGAQQQVAAAGGKGKSGKRQEGVRSKQQGRSGGKQRQGQQQQGGKHTVKGKQHKQQFSNGSGKQQSGGGRGSVAAEQQVSAGDKKGSKGKHGSGGAAAGSKSSKKRK